MKINIFCIGLCLTLVSCGNKSSTQNEEHTANEDPIFSQACECLDLANVLQVEFSKATSSDEQQNVKSKYQEQIDVCDKVIRVYGDGFKDLNERESKERKQKMGAICPAYKDIPQ